MIATKVMLILSSTVLLLESARMRSSAQRGFPMDEVPFEDCDRQHEGC